MVERVIVIELEAARASVRPSSRSRRAIAALFAAGSLLTFGGLAPVATATAASESAAATVATAASAATAAGQNAVVAREVQLERIVRLERTGKRTDARQLMPLLKSADSEVRRAAEQTIWLLWGRSGNTRIDRLFRDGMVQLGRDEIEEAIATFTRVVDNLPAFAEAWNKRATARFLAGDLAGAMDDCERTLALAPDHFGSLAGYGHIYFRLDDLDMAILYWRRALEVNPNLQSVARSIDAAQRILAGRGRLTT